MIKPPSVIALALVFAAACSPTSSAPANPESTKCAVLQRCEPAMFNNWFASMNDCFAFEKSAFGAYYSLAGIDQDQVNAFGALSDKATCSALNVNGPHGTLANGASCIQAIQCASGNCSSAGNGCGTCVGAAAGGACVQDTDCAVNLTCVAGACTVTQPNGALCTEDAQCQSGYCGPPMADALQTGNDFCEDSPALPVGSTCTKYDDCAIGLQCTSSCTDVACTTPTPSVCTQPAYVAIGQPCTGICQGGYCEANICTAFVAPGGACTSNAQCRVICVFAGDGGTTGQCDIANIPTCH